MIKGEPAKLVDIPETNTDLIDAAKKAGAGDELFFSDALAIRQLAQKHGTYVMTNYQMRGGHQTTQPKPSLTQVRLVEYDASGVWLGTVDQDRRELVRSTSLNGLPTR